MPIISWKKLALVIILAQLILLPVLLIASRNQQETRSRASVTAQDETVENYSEGNAMLSVGRDFSGDPVAEPETRSSIDTQQIQTTGAEQNNPVLKKEVYAYLPYWEVDSEANTYLQYKFLTHLIYHGISLGKNGVIKKTNSPYATWTSPNMTTIVNNARQRGVKVIPNIVLFNSSGNTNLNDFLDDPVARDKAVNEIVEFLNTSPQPVDGVAIDFEYPGSAQKEELVDFMHKLRLKMNETNPNWDLIIAVDGYSFGGGGFDLPKLAQDVDSFFVMSYHLRNASTATRAGSTNPYGALNNLADNYIAKIPADKVVLGFPLYLSEWKTVDDSLRADKVPNTGGGITVDGDCGLSGTTCTRLAQRYAATYGKKYDTRDKAAYYSFYVCTGTKQGWRQVYFDDEQAFTEKFGIANNKNLRGVGFWAQNYDKGYLDTWKAIYNAFADKTKTGAPTRKAGFVNPAAITHNGCVPPSGVVSQPVTPILSQSPTPTPGTGSTIIRFDSIKLHGIGRGGDNTNPTLVGNQTPLRTTRSFTVELEDSSGKTLPGVTGNITYRPTTGDFTGDITLPSTIQEGPYLVKVKSPQFLKRRALGILDLKPGNVNNIPIVTLITGDINNDNYLTLADYNILLDCYSEFIAPKNCDANKKLATDITDDGKVDRIDYSQFIRELGTVKGD